MQVITFKGSTFGRHVEILGDVEKITWYQTFEEGQGTDIEIYDPELSIILEDTYVETCLAVLTPQLFFI
jgi:hypothetical protein